MVVDPIKTDIMVTHYFDSDLATDYDMIPNASYFVNYFSLIGDLHFPMSGDLTDLHCAKTELATRLQLRVSISQANCCFSVSSFPLPAQIINIQRLYRVDQNVSKLVRL